MGSPAATLARAQEALQAGRSARIVRRARLAPATAEDGAQMRFALEDALNTADFGDCGRLIVVRRLRLQGVPVRASSGLLARALEEAWRALAPAAVPAWHPQAESAQAVYFGSRFDARLAWLEALASERQVHAWFWRAALPELAVAHAKHSRDHAVELVVAALLEESAREMLEALRKWNDDSLVALARRVPHSSGERLLAAATRAPRSGASTSTASTDASPSAIREDVQVTWAPVLQRLARFAGVADRPPAWVAALWLGSSSSELPTFDQVLRVMAIARTHDAALAPGPGPDDADPIPEAHALTRVRDAGALQTPGLAAPGNRAVPARAGQTDPRPVPSPVHEPRGWKMEAGLQPSPAAVTHRHSPLRSAAAPWLLDAVPTTHGGLLLLLNVLHALRFERWLAAQPADARWEMVSALFEHVLRVTGCARDDPQLRWFESEAEPAEGLAATARRWTLRVRRALRRHARMDLPELIRRQAWVGSTPTHIDVVFPLDEVDLRLRRLGLDSDPGWVPWFRRIVAFHFIARDRLPPDDEPEEAADG